MCAHVGMQVVNRFVNGDERLERHRAVHSSVDQVRYGPNPPDVAVEHAVGDGIEADQRLLKVCP